MSETFERLELKYIVDEVTASRLRRDVLNYCSADAFQGEGQGYGLHSLYLDTPQLAFHEAKLRSDPDRLKLRVRRYDNDQVYLEVKRKTVDVVRKRRARAGADWAQFAQGNAPANADDAAEYFAQLACQWGVEPKLLVYYEREAYTGQFDSYARVTFDRSLRVQPVSDWVLHGEPGRWIDIDPDPDWPGNSVILELKCETMMPPWMAELVQAYRLQRSAFSKYSAGIFADRAASLGMAMPAWSWSQDV